MGAYYVSDFQTYRSFLDRWYQWDAVMAACAVTGGDFKVVYDLAVRIDREAARLAAVERLDGRKRVPQVEVTSYASRRAVRRRVSVVFAQVVGGEVVYRDTVHADSVEAAVSVRFPGGLPDGFVVEAVHRLV